MRKCWWQVFAIISLTYDGKYDSNYYLPSLISRAARALTEVAKIDFTINIQQIIRFKFFYFRFILSLMQLYNRKTDGLMPSKNQWNMIKWNQSLANPSGTDTCPSVQIKSTADIICTSFETSNWSLTYVYECSCKKQ